MAVSADSLDKKAVQDIVDQHKDGKETGHGIEFVKHLGKSHLWVSFQKLKLDGVVVPYVVCTICYGVLKYTPSDGTGGMKRHVHRVRQEAASSNTQLKISGFTSTTFEPGVYRKAKKQITTSVVQFCAKDIRPFNIVEGEGFKGVARELINFGAKYGRIQVEQVLPCGQTISNNVDETYKKLKEAVNEELRKVVDENGNNKKVKVEDVQEKMCKDAIITSAWSPEGNPGLPVQRPSAFRPWSPSALAKEGKAVLPEHGTVLVRNSRGIPSYLSMGPPVLLNPERVIPHTAATKFDGHFAPNVSLVPQATVITPKEEEAEPSRTTPNGENTAQDSNTSESDESSVSPKLACEDSVREDGHSEVAVETSLEQEIDMVRSLLENEPLDSQAGRDKLLHKLARIRVRQEERLQNALASKKSLQQELEFLRVTKKEKLREASETKRNLRKEIDRIRIEYERKLREASDAKQRLKRDLEIAKSKKCDKTHELGKDKVRLRAENEYLRERLSEVEEERDQLKKEMDELKKQLTDSGSEKSEKESSKSESSEEQKLSDNESTSSDSSTTKACVNS